MALARQAGSIEIPPLKIGRIKLHLIGDAPLVCHRFDEKKRREMLDKQMGKAKQGKEPKDPVKDFMGCLYVLPGSTPVLHDEDLDNVYCEGRFGFPAIAFKAAAVRAANDVGLKMTDMRRAFHIEEEMVEILSESPPHSRVDTVRLESGVADVRFRAEFTNWWAFPTIRYNEGIMNTEKIINLFRTAGFGVGVGEWRPEKNGMWGMFHVGAKVETLKGESQ